MLYLRFSRLPVSLVTMAVLFMAALDATKAFDRVCHLKLSNKLVERNVPACLIAVLCNWYDKIYAIVRWNSVISHTFLVKCGILQGGVLSLCSLIYVLMI